MTYNRKAVVHESNDWQKTNLTWTLLRERVKNLIPRTRPVEPPSSEKNWLRLYSFRWCRFVITSWKIWKMNKFSGNLGEENLKSCDIDSMLALWNAISCQSSVNRLVILSIFYVSREDTGIKRNLTENFGTFQHILEDKNCTRWSCRAWTKAKCTLHAFQTGKVESLCNLEDTAGRTHTSLLYFYSDILRGNSLSCKMGRNRVSLYRSSLAAKIIFLFMS